MTRQLEFGDTVTSRFLMGEWMVLKVLPGGRTEVCKGGNMVRIQSNLLSYVPPEPKIDVVRMVAEELAYQFMCGGSPAEEYMQAAEAVVRVVRENS